MRKLFPILALVVLTTILAGPILAAGYVVQINVVESAGTSYTRLPMIATLNNTYLAANGLIATNALDTRVINSANVTLPHLVADNKTLFVDNITASSTAVFQYKSGQSALASMPIVVGQGGRVTVADNSKWEPKDSFGITLSVYLKETGTVFEKPDALKLYYNATTRNLTLTAGNTSSPDYTLTASNVSIGEHTVIVDSTFVSTASSNLTIYPASAGDYENILAEIPNGTAHYLIMKGNVTWPYADYLVYDSYSQADLYTFDSTGGVSSLDAVTLAIWTGNNYSSRVRFLIKMQGQSLWTSDYINTYGVDWTIPYLHTLELLTNPVTGAPWQVADLTGIQFGFNCVEDGGMNTALEMHVILSAGLGQPKIELFVDNFVTPAASADMTVPIPDNSNDWQLYPNPYINYFKVETSS